MRKAVELTIASFGKIDIFVNNAGILIRGSVEGYSIEDFDHMVAVNVRAPFVAAQAASRQMTSGGRIILIGSTTADRVAFPGASVYSMTKSALATAS